jgi:hypothetical protein
VAERTQSSASSNKKAEIDIRSLNLHLRARVVEILGCSEAMWDWVKELQYRESEKERKHKEQVAAVAAAAAAKTIQGVGGGRVSYYHRDRTRRQGGTRERMNSGESDHSALRRQKSTNGFAGGTNRNKRGDDGGDQGTISGYSAESPSLYSKTSSGSGKVDDPSEHMERSVKQELLHMTRDRFDEVLSWFQL